MTAGVQFLASVRMNLFVIMYRMVPRPNQPPNQQVLDLVQSVKKTKQIKFDMVKNKWSVTSMPIYPFTDA